MSLITGNYLAFDYGDKRIGVAVGQSVTQTARPLDVLKADNGQPDWQQIADLLANWQPKLVIIGLPLNMDGTTQSVTQRAQKFANRIQGRFAIQIDMMDERLSSVVARSELVELYGSKALKQPIDSLAACHILESWFAIAALDKDTTNE